MLKLGGYWLVFDSPVDVESAEGYVAVLNVLKQDPNAELTSNATRDIRMFVVVQAVRIRYNGN